MFLTKVKGKWRLARHYCDNCGKVNPPVTSAGNNRVTLCCVEKGGMYRVPEDTRKGYGSNGKRSIEYARWPFKWRGFWGWL